MTPVTPLHIKAEMEDITVRDRIIRTFNAQLHPNDPANALSLPGGPLSLDSQAALDGLQANLMRLQPNGGTAYYDAACQCLRELQAQASDGDVAVLLVVTDGQDTSSECNSGALIGRGSAALRQTASLAAGQVRLVVLGSDDLPAASRAALDEASQASQGATSNAQLRLGQGTGPTFSRSCSRSVTAGVQHAARQVSAALASDPSGSPLAEAEASDFVMIGSPPPHARPTTVHEGAAVPQDDDNLRRPLVPPVDGRQVRIPALDTARPFTSIFSPIKRRRGVGGVQRAATR